MVIVICAISSKKIGLENLNYWNVELQEAYYSYVEASKKGKYILNHFHRLCVQIHCEGFFLIILLISLLSSQSNFSPRTHF